MTTYSILERRRTGAEFAMATETRVPLCSLTTVKTTEVKSLNFLFLFRLLYVVVVFLFLLGLLF